jgi:phenylacetic acid degradation operon negative regulatory protein
MKPTARHLILDLLLAVEDQALAVREFIAGCALFGISENNVRVALARLAADGHIEAEARGSYRLSASAHELADEVATWRRAEQRLRPWAGGYLVVHAGSVSRLARSALRRRTRALAMLGFRELDRGLYVRPDNFADRVEIVRQRLHTLGLEDDAAVFVVAAFDPPREARIRKLWNGRALSAGYRRQRQRLEAWMQRSARLDRDAAAREAYLLGSAAIREVVFDPWLPEPFVDVAARQAFVEVVRRFDRHGQAIWRHTRQLALAAESTPARPMARRTRPKKNPKP